MIYNKFKYTFMAFQTFLTALGFASNLKKKNCKIAKIPIFVAKSSLERVNPKLLCLFVNKLENV